MHSKNKSIENVVLSAEMIKCFNEACEKMSVSEHDFPVSDLDYEAYSLSEVAVMAKKDSVAMDEFLHRVDPVLVRYGKYICDFKQFVDFSEILSVLQKAACKVVEVYDPTLGYPVDNLLRKNLKSYFHWYLKNEAVQYYRRLAALGKRVSVEDITFYDNIFAVESPEREIVEKIDFDVFQGTLSGSDRQMLLLYLTGYSFRDIAQVMLVSPSTVSYRIYKALDSFQARCKKKGN